MTAFTLVVIFYLGSNTGQNIVVPGFSTREACQEAGSSLAVPWASRPIIRCFEVLR
jgi:hypothetical protein